MMLNLDYGVRNANFIKVDKAQITTVSEIWILVVCFKIIQYELALVNSFSFTWFGSRGIQLLAVKVESQGPSSANWAHSTLIP